MIKEPIPCTPHQRALMDALKADAKKGRDDHQHHRAEMYRAQETESTATENLRHLEDFLKTASKGRALTWILRPGHNHNWETLTDKTYHQFYANGLHFTITLDTRTDIKRSPYYVSVDGYRNNSYSAACRIDFRSEAADNATGHPHRSGNNSIVRRYKTREEQLEALDYFKSYIIEKYAEKLLHDYCILHSIDPQDMDDARRAEALDEMKHAAHLEGGAEND